MKKYLPILLVWLMSNCIDPIHFSTDEQTGALVVDGLITDERGPYYVKISRTQGFYEEAPTKVSGAKVTAYDNAGGSLDFYEVASGLYRSDSVLFGSVGREYHIEIEVDEEVYRSKPEKLLPVPDIDKIYFEFERRTRINENNVNVPDNGFRIYIDARFDPGDDVFLRWKWNGTYKTITYPEQHTVNTESGPKVEPLPCSCCILVDGELVNVGKCSCCECWVDEKQHDVVVSDAANLNERGIQRQNITFVGVDRWRFLDKYYIEVKQYSLSEEAFNFWRLVDLQEKNKGTIFDTPPADITSNLFNINNAGERVYGYFAVSSVARASLFIRRSDIPYAIQLPEILKGDCRWFRDGKNVKPEFWID